MYSIGILEDEVIEQEVLQMIVKTRHPGLRVAFVADSGDAARQCLLLDEPDILLLDVNVPGENGLDFARDLRKRGYAGLIIVNTAYAQFEYAQSAVQINAFDYLLKPCDPERISQTLLACEKKLRQRDEHQSQLLSLHRLMDAYLFEHIAEGDARLLRHLNDCGWPENGRLQAFVLRFSSASLPAAPIEAQEFGALTRFSPLFLHARVQPDALTVVAQPQTPLTPSRLRAILTAYALKILSERACYVRCVVSPQLTALEDIARTANAMAGETLTREEPITFLSPSPACGAYKKYALLVSRLSRMLRDCKISRLRLTIFAALDDIAEDDADADFLVLCALMNALYQCSLSEPLDAALRYLEHSQAPVRDALNDLINDAARATRAYDGQGSMNLARAIIDREFAAPLSQADVARRVGMSQSYFSIQFKKHTRMNFVDYLTQTRMEYAKSRIEANDTLTLEQLAQVCGCMNRHYFCNVFRRYTGMTVSQYKTHKAERYNR